MQHHSFRLLLRMRPGQAFGFTLIQSYYGSVAVILLTGISLTTAHLVFGLNALSVPFGEWLSYWFPQLSISIAIWYWLQRFYLRESDRGWGVRAILAGIGAMVVYTQAFVTSLFGRSLAYVITPKGEVGTREPLRLFRWHLVSLAVSLGALGWSIWHSEGAPTIRFWAVLNSIQMLIVIGTGVVAPGVLRTRISWKWFDSMSRYAVRVAVPITAGVGGLIVAALISTGPSSSGQTPPVAPVDMTPVTQEPTTVALTPTPTPTSTPTPTPVGPVSASFLEPGSSAVAFGEFTLGGPFDISAKVHHEFIDFAPGSIERLQQAVDRAAAANQVAMLSWEPKFAGRPLESTGLIAQIDAGAFDDYLAGAAAALRDTDQPILLRFAPEMDHVSDELHPWSGEQPELFISAWRRIHAIFQEQGASNVLFAWTPGGYLVDGVFASDDWYPGDDVVDFVGFTAYAFWVWEEWDEERAATHAYRSPEELILPRYEALLEHGKPVIIPELGISLHPTLQAEQAAWLVALIDFIDRDLPELAAIVYFHAPHTFIDVDIDWRLTPEEQGVLAERLAASDRIELSAPAR